MSLLAAALKNAATLADVKDAVQQADLSELDARRKEVREALERCARDIGDAHEAIVGFLSEARSAKTFRDIDALAQRFQNDLAEFLPGEDADDDADGDEVSEEPQALPNDLLGPGQ